MKLLLWFFASLVVLSIVFVVACLIFSPPWAGFTGKTLWDFLGLCLGPAVLAALIALGGVWWKNREDKLTRQRDEQQQKQKRELEDERRKQERELEDKRREQESALQRDRFSEAALQKYYDCVTDLILKEKLPASPLDAPIRDVARARTLAALSELDGKRKAMVVQFLFESELLWRKTPISECVINLEDANLTSIDLRLTKLAWRLSPEEKEELRSAQESLMREWSQRVEERKKQKQAGEKMAPTPRPAEKNPEDGFIGVCFRFVNLAFANLSGAHLQSVDLFGANLADANLESTHLAFADLRRTNLRGARLGGAELYGADLSTAEGLCQAQLEGTKGNRSVKLPKGLVAPESWG